MTRCQGGFVHEESNFDLDVVAGKLVLPPHAIGTSYVDEGLSKYGKG